ncbi:MAG: hypothetical protein PHO08_08230 [Methylococcales bacterium]|nr:hypothetical protein [Methylococcales bacterium]
MNNEIVDGKHGEIGSPDMLDAFLWIESEEKRTNSESSELRDAREARTLAIAEEALSIARDDLSIAKSSAASARENARWAMYAAIIAIIAAVISIKDQINALIIGTP